MKKMPQNHFKITPLNFGAILAILATLHVVKEQNRQKQGELGDVSSLIDIRSKLDN